MPSVVVGSGFVGAISTIFCGSIFHCDEKLLKRNCRQFRHARHQLLHVRRASVLRRTARTAP